MVSKTKIFISNVNLSGEFYPTGKLFIAVQINFKKIDTYVNNYIMLPVTFATLMRILFSKILIITLLLSVAMEITITAFTHAEVVYILIENDESKEEKKEKEENKDKISSKLLAVSLSAASEIRFFRNQLIMTSAFKSLPEIPPDQI